MKAGHPYDKILLGLLKLASQYGQMTRKKIKSGIYPRYNCYQLIIDTLDLPDFLKVPGLDHIVEADAMRVVRLLSEDLETINLTKYRVKWYAIQFMVLVDAIEEARKLIEETKALNEVANFYREILS